MYVPEYYPFLYTTQMVRIAVNSQTINQSHMRHEFYILHGRLAWHQYCVFDDSFEPLGLPYNFTVTGHRFERYVDVEMVDTTGVIVVNGGSVDSELKNIGHAFSSLLVYKSRYKHVGYLVWTSN